MSMFKDLDKHGQSCLLVIDSLEEVRTRLTSAVSRLRTAAFALPNKDNAHDRMNSLGSALCDLENSQDRLNMLADYTRRLRIEVEDDVFKNLYGVDIDESLPLPADDELIAGEGGAQA